MWLPIYLCATADVVINMSWIIANVQGDAGEKLRGITGLVKAHSFVSGQTVPAAVVLCIVVACIFFLILLACIHLRHQSISLRFLQFVLRLAGFRRCLCISNRHGGILEDVGKFGFLIAHAVCDRVCVAAGQRISAGFVVAGFTDAIHALQL